MRKPGKPLLAMLTLFLFVAAPVISPSALAAVPPASPQHVVSNAQLHDAVNASMKTRQADVAKVQGFLSSPRARQAMEHAGLDYRQVSQAVPMLSASELADLSARAERAQREFQAGSLTNQQITYIIIALATAVIILIIVEH